MALDLRPDPSHWTSDLIHLPWFLFTALVRADTVTDTCFSEGFLGDSAGDRLPKSALLFVAVRTSGEIECLD